MAEDNLAHGVAYYQAMNDKKVDQMAQYLALEVQLISPLSELSGKDAVLEAAQRLFQVFHRIDIRAQFSSGDQVMLALNMDCPLPIGAIRTAVLQSFKNNLITRIELFLDPRPLVK
jgi:SnoaL-like protein